MFGAGMDDKLNNAVVVEELNADLELPRKSQSLTLISSESGFNLAICDELQWNEILELGESDEFVNEILQAFIQEAEELRNRLPELVSDPGVLASEAHKLKGAAGYVGAIRAAYFCGLVESAAKASPSQLDERAVMDLKNALSVSVEYYRKRAR
jgi:HPt (histidine-containing phosphotransfer) domain-containing protein